MIAAIETKWRGFRFRSRTEARWAVFLEAYGARWEYEPESVRLSDGRLYLPDFRVRLECGRDFWLEVKPETGCSSTELDGPRHVGAMIAYGVPQPFLPLHHASECAAAHARDWACMSGISCFCINDRYEHRTWSINESHPLSLLGDDKERWAWCGDLAAKAVKASRAERFGAHD